MSLMLLSKPVHQAINGISVLESTTDEIASLVADTPGILRLLLLSQSFQPSMLS